MLETDLKAQHAARIGIASVVPVIHRRLHARLREITPAPVLDVGPSLMLPFALAYQTPETLGADRLAAAAAAWHHYGKGQPMIVIDAGTALTIDVVQDGAYLGGTISAGPDLEGRALTQGTAALPPITEMTAPSAVGASTTEALQSGLLHGLTDRVQRSIDRLTPLLGAQRIVVATGGWHAFLAQHVDTIDHIDPHLVLRGVQLLMALNPA